MMDDLPTFSFIATVLTGEVISFKYLMAKILPLIFTKFSSIGQRKYDFKRWIKFLHFYE
jgi:hypothetical protein